MKITKEIRDFVSRTTITKVSAIQSAAEIKKDEVAKKYSDAFCEEYSALRKKYEKMIQAEYPEYELVYNGTSHLPLQFVKEKKVYNRTYDNGVSYDIIDSVLARLSLIRSVSTIEDIEKMIDIEISKVFI